MKPGLKQQGLFYKSIFLYLHTKETLSVYFSSKFSLNSVTDPHYHQTHQRPLSAQDLQPLYHSSRPNYEQVFRQAANDILGLRHTDTCFDCFLVQVSDICFSRFSVSACS